MTLRIGVIADDLTGATDISGFLVAAGLRTVQVNGLAGLAALAAEGREAIAEAGALVIGLKTRSIPADEAVAQSLDALRVLQQLGAERIVFKYCSTFDSTPAGNIGPVADALLDAIGVDFAVAVPALPVNGRTVFQGMLFVHDVPLAESSMREHPITPMTDSSVVRLLAAQTSGTVGLVPFAAVEQGPEAVRAALAASRAQGARFAVVDALTHDHLDTIGEAVRDAALVTGGSGIGSGLARALVRGATDAAEFAPEPWRALDTRTVLLSGSASRTTNRQVAAYVASGAPAEALDIERVMRDPESYTAELVSRVLATPADGPAPLVYATAQAESVAETQARYGGLDVSGAIETWFGGFARELRERGVGRFVVAGGETSGSVTLALGITGCEIGPLVAPGVPLTRSLDGACELVLKSGNFGADAFFADAQRVAASPGDALGSAAAPVVTQAAVTEVQG